ncbi:hypothetical protein BDV39DRAFT_165682 [Aspergillus sergii]|uniref:Uncharacterized protein n=1 Tax=Aspergillus sergii TaxID=1034303 RepID=A0A5N6XP53_9EURO|nr:hypothetical protein BDV39DRAFT_165682 [Aspergillus sergii]
MNTGPKQILDTLIQNLIAKQANQGILTLRQVAFSKSDIRIHEADSQPATSIRDVYNSLLQERRPCAAQRATSTAVCLVSSGLGMDAC